MRNLVNGVMNVLSAGCQWRYIPRIRTNPESSARLGSIVYNTLRCRRSDAIPRDRSATALGGLTSACTAAIEEALLQREADLPTASVQGTAEDRPLMWKGTVHVYTVLHYRPRAGRGASVQTIRS